MNESYIVDIIVKNDLNLTDLANYTGISISKINKVMQGESTFDVGELELLKLRLVRQNCVHIRKNNEINKVIMSHISKL